MTSATTGPFLGPRPFQTGETLYGRASEARALLSLLIVERTVLLHSPSGAGKTSLVQAMLIPMLEERGFTVLPTVRVGQESPSGYAGNRYSRAALLTLEEGHPPEEQLPLVELEAVSLEDYLARRVPAEADVVLILDQFEEVLTRDPTDRAAKEAFFRELGEALRAPRLWALFVIREEYVAALEPYTRLLSTRLSAHFRLDMLGVEGALAALREPPRERGVAFGEALAARLVDDLRRVNVQQADGSIVAQLGPTVEPVQLQVVGLRLWQLLPPGAAALTANELAQLGEVGTALGDYYAAQMAAVAAATCVPERALRAWFERELITPQGVRGEVLQGQGESAGLPDAAVRRLVDAYLVRAEPRRGALWYELAHDRLIAPVRAGNAAWFAANLSTLQRQADLWAQQGRPAGLLLRGATLREAERWAGENAELVTGDERELLRRSREAERQARRVRNLAIGASVLALCATLAFVTALWFYNLAEEQRREAERQARVSRARMLAADAVSNLLVDPQRSLLLARAAIEQTRAVDGSVVPEAEASLQQALQASRVRQIIQVGERGLQDLAMSHDGRILATSGNDGVVRIFDAEGTPRLAIAAGDPALDQPAMGLALSPDGGRIAAGFGATVMIWDTASGAALLALEGHRGDVIGLAFSPDGITLASAGYDGLVILWDAASGAERRRLDLGEVEVNAVDFSPLGDRLVTGDSANRVIIWDLAAGSRLHTLDDHAAAVLGVAWDPLDEVIATASEDLTVRLWDAATGEQLDVLRGHSSTVETVAFSPDGALLATGGRDGTARLWDVGNGDPVLTLAGHGNLVSGALFSPDGASLVTASLDGSLRRWDLSLAPAGGAYVVALSPDGKILATSGEEGAALWDVTSGARLRDIPSAVEVLALAWSPDGTILALGDEEGRIVLADPADGAELRTLEGHGARINRLAFSPDGRALASVSDDRSARLWDMASGASLWVSAEQAYELTALAWAPDGQTLALGDLDGWILIWDAAAGHELRRMNLYSGEIVLALAYSPDGAALAAGDEGGVLALFDPHTGNDRGRINAGGPLNDLAYSPDGTTLATGGRDKTVRLWEAASLVLARTIPHPAEVYSLAYSPDGTTLATAAADGQARLVPLALEDLLDLAAQRTYRSLTDVECDTYGLTCAPNLAT